MSLRVAVTELMVWGREGWAGAADATLLSPTLGVCRQTHSYKHITLDRSRGAQGEMPSHRFSTSKHALWIRS